MARIVRFGLGTLLFVFAATAAQATPISITKSFGGATVPAGGATTLTFTVTNVDATPHTNVTWTDNFPAGMVLTNTTLTNVVGCTGGSITGTAGSTSVTVGLPTLIANSSCTLTMNVTVNTAGVKSNTTNPVTSVEGGAGNSASASITAVVPPMQSQTANPTTIPLNGTSTITFTVQNNDPTTTLTNVTFTDSLPAGIVLLSPPIGVTNSCSGGLTLSFPPERALMDNSTLAPGASCSFSFRVVGTTGGAHTNVPVAVTSSQGGTGNAATADIFVVLPPALAKSFGAASIPVGGTTSLTFTVQNPNDALHALSAVAFTDTLPAGLVVATPNGLTSNCGGTTTATAGSGSVSLSGASVPGNSNCTIGVNVTGTTSGTMNNTTGSVTSTEGGTGNTASASLDVAGAPTITKSFGAASIALNATTSLSFTVTNPNAALTLTSVAFTDTLPAGLVVATPNGLTGSCGGGTITATAASGTVSLSGASLAGSASCTFSVNVLGTSAGVKNNTTGSVTSTNGGTGNTASASLDVAGAPTITKSFGAASIALNATTSLSFTVTNPNAALTLTSVAFTDTLPAGLVVATPNGLTGSCGGGTITATAASSAVSLSGASLAGSASCTFSVNVLGTSVGLKNNTTGSVTSTNGGTGNTASASLDVAGAPTITKSFGAASIPLNATTSLSFTVTNPNAALTLTSVAFTDTLPAGLVVATPNGLTGSCGGGAITATAASGTVSLSGASLAGSASCTFSVNVLGTSVGLKNNTTGSVTSTNGGTGNTASASLAVVAAPAISKSFGAATIAPNATTSLSFTVTNPNAASTLSAVAFTDTLPAGLVVATPNALTGSCGGGTITATAGAGSVSLSGASLAGSASCTFAVNVLGSSVGVKNNTTGNVTSTEGGAGNTASASLAVLTTSFTGPTPSNGSATASFTGGGPTCTFATAAFIPLSGGPGSPPASTSPGGYTFPDGLFDFTTSGCTPGSTLNFTITYATPLQAGAVYWKYGPTPGNATPHWYVLPAAISGNTATFSITDGGLGDDDGVTGGIVDQGGPGVPGTATAVPTLSQWALMVLAGLLLLAAGFGPRLRRRS